MSDQTIINELTVIRRDIKRLESQESGPTGGGVATVSVTAPITNTGTSTNPVIGFSGGGGGTVTAVTGTAPIASSGGAAPAISWNPTAAYSNNGFATQNFRFESLASDPTGATGRVYYNTASTAVRAYISSAWQSFLTDTYSFSGDISGTIAGGVSVDKVHGVAVTGTTSAGKVLTSTGTAAATWQNPAGGPPTGAAGGDLAGTYPNPTLSPINGFSQVATYPAEVDVDASGRVTFIQSGNPPAEFMILTNQQGSTVAANKLVAWIGANYSFRLADSGVTNDYPAWGFTTAGPVLNLQTVSVQFSGRMAGFTGLTSGAFYYSDPATPGNITATPPTTAGQKSQLIGRAIATDTLLINISEPITIGSASASSAVQRSTSTGRLVETAFILSGAAAGGDLTGTYPNPTLAAAGAGAGTFSSPSSVTVDAKGRVTSITAGGGGTTFTVNQSTGSTIATNKAVAWVSSGNVQLADSGATNDFPVIGFTTAAILTGGTGTAQSGGLLSGFTGLTSGALYFSDPATPGGITATVPVTANQKLQIVGRALSTTTLVLEIEEPVKLGSTSSPASPGGLGTTFPAFPAVYDRFYRTDRGIEYFWNGTYWLSMQQFTISFFAGNTATSIAFSSSAIGYPRNAYAIYLESFEAMFGVATTYNASNYWSWTIRTANASGTTADPLTASMWAGGQVINKIYPHTSLTNYAVADPGASLLNPVSFQLLLSLTGAPGALTIYTPTICYRLIG